MPFGAPRVARLDGRFGKDRAIADDRHKIHIVHRVYAARASRKYAFVFVAPRKMRAVCAARRIFGRHKRRFAHAASVVVYVDDLCGNARYDFRVMIFFAVDENVFVDF